MKKAIALLLASAVIGCAGDPPLEGHAEARCRGPLDGGKPPPGGISKPVTPGTDLTVKPVKPEPAPPARSIRC